MGKKLTPNQAEFERQTKRIRGMMRGLEKQGYKFTHSPIDDLPQRVSAKKITELQSVTADTLKRYADKPDATTPKGGKHSVEEAPRHRTSHMSDDEAKGFSRRRGGHGNPENLQHKGNPHGNPENLQHNGNPHGNPANLQHKGNPHGNPANLQHKGNPHGNPANLQHNGNPHGNPANLKHNGNPHGNPANLQHNGNPHGNPANLQHKGNPHGNPANLQHKGNPANLKPHPENLKPHPENLRRGGRQKGGGGGGVNKPKPKDTDLYGIIYSTFWEIIDYDFKSAYGQTGRDIVADWANHMIDKYGEEMFVIGLNIAASDGHVLSTEMMYDDALRLDFFMEVVKAINDQLGEHTGFEDRHETELFNRRDLGQYHGTNPAMTLNERINELTADSRYQQGEEENYYTDWD